MTFLLTSLIYLMFFLSGAAALIYQVVWVRSLTLIFGGSHLAVTAVLSIFMAGLAAGGYIIGKFVDTVRKPLRLYGLLELGIAFSAMAFIGFMKLYPAVYIALARGKDDSPLYLTLIRITFSVIALIVPTTLMGGTLPVLTKFVSNQRKDIGRRLSFLYGFNTLGAVLGAAGAGFVLLRLYSSSTTLYTAILINTAIGLASMMLQSRVSATIPEPLSDAGTGGLPDSPVSPDADSRHKRENLSSLKLVLWGIGVSGFCALGYEVLWSRILTIVVGASVYGFTTMLIAFLTGIALGSKTFGLLAGRKGAGLRNSVPLFGIVQIVIGATALVVTIYIRDLPANITRLQSYFSAVGNSFFAVKLWSNFVLAFSYMVVPAFFMGLAFPLAGAVHAEYRKAVGSAVGEVLAYNTVGAILGAALSGFVMIYLFGIERSLQMLIVINIGLGVLVLVGARNSRTANAAVAGAALAALAFLGLNHQDLRIWDTKYFAIYRNNQPDAFRTPEMIREAAANTDVLYYAEGVESIVSSVKIKGGEQSFITNGRVEASSHPEARLCQYTLGHLPMLLNRDPRQVLVVGTGSGMTLGATSIHPSVERITLVEIEPKVLGVARTFEKYNHHVLDNPKVHIIFNDGRNFLLTTDRKFDVITADPIHPWFRGAGYLYTTEYFKLASEHLRPGGVVCQWLPIYELAPADVRSIVRTFGRNFAYTMLWLTQDDAEMIGSNSPIVIDEKDLAKRIAEPAVAADLRQVNMGSAEEFLSYFVMGTEGMRNFGRGGIINTDDDLYLEFSAPFSIGKFDVTGDNASAISRCRESILPYLAPEQGRTARAEQVKKWSRNQAAAEINDQALTLYLRGQYDTAAFKNLMTELASKYPWFAPGKFLRNEYEEDVVALNPALLQRVTFLFSNGLGKKVMKEISAVLVPISRTRASIVFVDNAARVVYGQITVSRYTGNVAAHDFVRNVIMNLQDVYHQEAERALGRKQALPPFGPTMRKMQDAITMNVQGYRGS